MQRRAVGLIRVSQTRGREGESFHSPATQRTRIEDACTRDRLRLIDVHEELDVSGGHPLNQRPGLSAAIAAIEAGEADVIVAAYLDRLTRSMRVREEVIERVEAAGGSVLTVDMGIQTNGTATQWLTGTLGSAVSEYIRRATAERTALAQQRSIDRGIPPWPSIPPGYKRPIVGHRPDGSVTRGGLVPDPKVAPTVLEAFERRAGGATITEVRAFLRERGIRRSYHGVQTMLRSRVYRGEINFGRYEPNLEAHLPIIDQELWQVVQRVRVPRGRHGVSNRLLARLGVLRCGSCGARLVVGSQTQKGKRYPFYRCPPTGDCTQRVTISATIAEQVISDQVKTILADQEGHASAHDSEREAGATLERAQAKLDATLRAFAGFEDEGAARERLLQLQEIRDVARSRAEELGGLRSAVTIRAGEDWDRLSLDERRALIRAVVERAVVGQGRGAERIRVDLFIE